MLHSSDKGDAHQAERESGRNLLVVVLLCGLVAAFLALAARCFYLQYFKSEHYVSAALRQRQKWVPQTPQRGVILDRRGRLLAASNKVQVIFAEPRNIRDCGDVSAKLGDVFGVEAVQIRRAIEESGNPGFARLLTGASAEQCEFARRIYGIGVQSEWQRHWPLGRLTCHVVGFTSRDNRGLGGLELQYDESLAGTGGRDIFFTDKNRRTIRLKEQGSPVVDGVGLILSIDATIQQFAHAELEKQYANFQAESAVALVADPRTGEILAMVSLPDFEPEQVGSADANCLRNRAITDTFEPGSIMKPIAAAIALDTGVVNTTERIFCENGNYRGKGFGRIGEYGNHRFGDLTLREIIIKSSNIGMAKVGQRLGKDRLYRGLRLFGFGEETGIDLPGEAEGLLSPPSKWTGYSVTRIPFGQEISVTAVQILRAFCVLANGGHSVRPHVVKAIVDNNGRIVKVKHPPAAVGYVVKPEVAEWIVKDAMVGVVNEKENGGTGWRAKLEKWQVFGKTGTANIARSDGQGYSDRDYVASFVAGAPAEEPRIVVLVSIRKPDKSLGKGYTGGVVASPVAARILERTLTYLERTSPVMGQQGKEAVGELSGAYAWGFVWWWSGRHSLLGEVPDESVLSRHNQIGSR